LPQRGVRTGEQRRDIRADGEEPDIAEVEQAGLADHHVQPDRDQAVPRDVEHRDGEVVTGFGGQDRWVQPRQCEDQHHNRDQDHPLLETAQVVPALGDTRPPGCCRGLGRRRSLGRGHTRAFPSDSPRMPVGRNISTSTSSTNATTSRHSPPNSAWPWFSMTPSSKPPSSAPRRLPMPPSTAAANALMPSRNPPLYWAPCGIFIM